MIFNEPVINIISITIFMNLTVIIIFINMNEFDMAQRPVSDASNMLLLKKGRDPNPYVTLRCVTLLHCDMLHRYILICIIVTLLYVTLLHCDICCIVTLRYVTLQYVVIEKGGGTQTHPDMTPTQICYKLYLHSKRPISKS